MDALYSIRAIFFHSCPSFFTGTNVARMGTNEKKPLKIGDRRSIELVASNHCHRYGLRVAANSAIGFGDPNTVRRTGAHIEIAGAFFVPARPVYGGCARETFGSAGLLTSRFANLRTAATLNRLATTSGSSSTLGAEPMTTFVTSKIRALAHRRMALSALRANSSLSVRLKRYNHHMAQARTLECSGGVQ